MVDQQIPEAVVKFHRQITLLLLSRVVEKTPVDTGRARVSWIVTTARASEAVAPKRKRKDSGQALTLATARAERSLVGLKPYTTTFISNNLPYIIRLETGYSQQAPSGMAGLSIQEIAVFLESAA